ncbi:MAG TPA: 2OG-Fe(II) oxygenase [Pseudonocardiaceae bacterium]
MTFETASELTPETLFDLAQGTIAAIHQKGFWSCADPAGLLARIDELCESSRYELTRDFASVGVSVGDAEVSPERAELYFSTALHTINDLRTAFSAVGFPGDTLRAVVDELWPYGATVGRVNGRSMLPLNVRKWSVGESARPHIDQCESPLVRALGLRKRIGMNLYVQAPASGSGGELDFWGIPNSACSYHESRHGSYGIERDALGEPLHVVRPEQGDLVLFDAARLHGVRRIDAGCRVTVAGFLGVRADRQPLVVFC